MTKTEANLQIAEFFSRLGMAGSSFDEKNFVAARVGESVIAFEYVEAQGNLAAQALIYRFRREPSGKALNAIFAEETDANCGGGRIVFDGESFSLFLQKDFEEKIAAEDFYEQINQLARASLIWNSEIIGNAAEKANNQ